MENYNENVMIEDVDMVDETEVVYSESESSGNGLSTVVAMAIGAGLTVATGATIKFVKKAVGKYKERKEQKSKKDAVEPVVVVDAEVIDVTDK